MRSWWLSRLGQLQIFVCVAEAGSFSAAGRTLNRAQSAVSYAIANLEELLGIALFVRTGRKPTLTEAGLTLLHDARRIIADEGDFTTRAASSGRSEESEVALVVDTVFPVPCLVDLCQAFKERYPRVELRVHAEVLSAVDDLVLDGTCTLGIASGIGAETEELSRSFLTQFSTVPVVCAGHPLTQSGNPLTAAQLIDHVQIAISERRTKRPTPDHAILSPRTWRVADAPTKLAMIRAGLGWGRLPYAMIKEHLHTGDLVQIQTAAWGPAPVRQVLQMVHRKDRELGVIEQWIIEQLRLSCLDCPGRGLPGCCL